MTKTIKRVILKSLDDSIRKLNNALEHCQKTYAPDHPHVVKLNKKVYELQRAVWEVTNL